MISFARFLSSASNISNAIEPTLTEVAFLGRSNVGKSSLINALCKHKNLAKSSSTPGKTRLINFFEVNYKQNTENIKLIFIDLPGFGYARVSKSLKADWDKNLDQFLIKRQNIKLFVRLIDSRHTRLDIDLQILAYLNTIKSQSSQILEVYTKADKLNQSQKTKLKNENSKAILVSINDKKSTEFLADKILKMSLAYE